MNALIRDIETRSEVDLPDVGPFCYARHPSTEVLYVSYAVNGDPVMLWYPGMPVPPVYKQAKREHWEVVAHNAIFEDQIERCILAPKFGFPTFPIEQQVCTMATAQALALPAALEDVAHVLKLKHQKDKDGHKAMLQVSKPRRARKDEDPNVVHWYDDEARMARTAAYCCKDTESERELFYALPPLIPQERELWLLDQKINRVGFYVDRKLAKAALEIIEQAKPIINAEMAKLTGGAVERFTLVTKLKEWLTAQGWGFESLGKDLIAELLKNPELPDNIQRVLTLRLLGAQAATNKVQALLDRAEADDRVRGAFMFHAAGTGRWSSHGVQVQNLKKPKTKDITRALRVIEHGSYLRMLEHYDNPMLVIGDCIRSMIMAPPGHTLYGADFSGIEARVTAWVAGETSKLEVFRKFDRTQDPLDDPYVVAAAKIFRLEPKDIDKFKRDIGKACELAFGFQGGVNAFRRFQPAGAIPTQVPAHDHWVKRHGKFDTTANKEAMAQFNKLFTDPEIDEIKRKWRAAHPNIERFWRAINKAALDAIRKPGTVIGCGSYIAVEYIAEAPLLWITLPSGRRITYPNIKLAKSDTGWGTDAKFMDNSAGQWRTVTLYGGLLTENIVQGIARDLLAEAMLRIDAAGYKIVAHIHDECVIEVPLHSNLEKFKTLMMVVPNWAEGLPISVKAWESTRYVKA